MAAFDTAIQKYTESPNELKQALHKYAAPLSKQGVTKTDKAAKPQLTEEEQSAVDNLMPFMLYIFDTIAESDMNESQKELLIYAIASNYVAIQEGCQTQPALNHYIQKMLSYKILRDVCEGKEVSHVECKEFKH